MTLRNQFLPFEQWSVHPILHSSLVAVLTVCGCHGGDVVVVWCGGDDDDDGIVERISKKKMKNEAKTTKPDTEWKRQSQDKAQV
ncbi:hypothetical protein Tco_0627523 [Tanacetum coccineum]|uniref:Secreted protein n=1 Tax=Tanacetum coccineum TaxID=301880 RepID=A0ABQ4WMP1_9ASTR